MEYIVEFEKEEVSFCIGCELQIGDFVSYEKDYTNPLSLQGQIIKRELYHYTDCDESKDTLFMYAKIRE